MVGRAMTAAMAMLLLAGCAHVPREAGFGDVQQQVSARIDHPVQWRGHTADDAAVGKAVGGLLAHPLGVEAAVQVALLNNLHLQATYQNLGVAQADLVQAGLLRNPTFGIERRFPGQALEIGVTGSFLDLFAIPLRKKVAASQFAAEKARVADAVLQTASQVRAAYYAYQADEQLLEMRKSIVDATAAAADMAQRMRQAGNIDQLDVDSHQSLAQQAMIEYSAAQGQAAQDRDRLAELMGLWGERLKWTIPARLADLPPADPTLDDLESLAISQRLDMAASRQDIETAARSLGFTKTFRFIPEIGIGGRYVHEIEPEHSIGPSLDLQIPIFDQGQAQTARGTALLEQKRFEYRAMAVDARSQVRIAYARMRSARDQATRYHDIILPLEKQIVDRSQLQYNGMFIGVFRLLEAKRGQIEAGKNYIESLRDYWIARSDLRRAVGGKLPAASPTTMPVKVVKPMPTTRPQMENHNMNHGGMQHMHMNMDMNMNMNGD